MINICAEEGHGATGAEGSGGYVGGLDAECRGKDSGCSSQAKGDHGRGDITPLAVFKVGVERSVKGGVVSAEVLYPA